MLRLLRWVCLNKLAGKPDEYVRWGAPKMRGTLFVDGRRVTRTKGRKGENKYLLDGSPFSAFRDSVPAEIASLLCMDADNFQRQMDPQFWLADSAGQVARNLNQIVNLEVMDNAQAAAHRKLRTAKVKLEVCAERLVQASEQRKALAWVPGANRLLSKLEKIDKRLDVKRSTIAQAGRTLSAVVDARRALVRASRGLPEARNAVAIGRRHAEAAERVKLARELVREVIKARDSLGVKPSDISGLRAMRKQFDAFAEKRRLGTELIQEYQRQEDRLCLLRKTLSGMKKSLSTHAPRRCPTCGQKIHKSSPSCAPMST